jgi:tetratricopeptide (TPR) repeat protein
MQKMKNLILIVLGMAVSMSGAFAQTAEKDMKKASKLLGIYHLDPNSNTDKLNEARTLIDGALASGEIDGDSKSWLTKGEIYNALAAEEAKATVLENGQVTDVALIAFDAFNNALDAAIKKWEEKEALKGMAETSGHLNTLGYTQYQRGEYASAYLQFGAVITINDLLESNEMKGVLGDEAAKMDQIYITAVSAMSANDMDAAAKYFLILKDKNFEKPIVYDGLYKAYLDKDEAKAESYLTEGREKFPEEKSLLFTEINHYLKAGKLDDLIEKLQVAIELEPTNASIYTTLGNVYDQLYQKALEGDDEAKTQELFENSKTNYDKALEHLNK